ncbi:TonB-dependent receptor plug domain-containing protein [Sphingomicrobium marinum]|uniref:TonB-dependent receptor plug domain-containing protein n=1 Tax=Sphingomicrobium marinum TaxID=1227950 RepID=UPI0022405321|nr:TonB-dependent receptor plug domain-containing protein [Sphingomicrobium marinum]
MNFRSVLLATAAIALAAPALAQESAPVDPQEGEADITSTPVDEDLVTDAAAANAPLAARSFTPADFTQFAPQNALDMVSRIPGFTIQGGDQGNRGLGQATQNVLINGQRVSGKSNDARDALRRIPANAVERIDIVDGATLAIPGLSGQVANIIADAGGWSGNFTYRPQFRRDHEARLLGLEISASGKVGSNDVSIGFKNDQFRNGNVGPEVRRNADGDIVRVVEEEATYFGDRPTITASLARTAANGNILNLNGSGQLFFFDREQVGFEVAADGSTARELNFGGEDEWNFELGGDYEFGLAGGRLKLIGLRRLESSEFLSVFERRKDEPGAVLRGSRFEQVIDEAETIARGEYSFAGLGGDMQVSLEGAYNSLDGSAELFVRNRAGEEVEVPLPGANALVEEKRAESIVSYGRPLAENLTLQASLGGEFSEISAGDITRSFVRPKGSISLAWKAADDLTVNAKVERRVDQLSFFQFLSSVDVTDDTDDRSNNFELVPPQRWRAELEFVKSLGAWGSITPEIRIASIEDTVEVIPISPTEQALGNLDSNAFVIQGILEGTLLFDPIGFDGARLNIFMIATETSVEDPLTGDNRDISGVGRFFTELSFRHDIPNSNWAWGTGLEFNDQAPNVSLDQVSRGYASAPFGWLFVENKDVSGMTVRASLMNIFDQHDRFERTVYVDRRDGPIAFSEYQDRDFGPIFELTITGSI